MEKQVQVKRRNTPGVIARLMGLETLPAQSQHKKKRETNKWLQYTSMGFRGRHVSCEDSSLRTSVNYQQDFKDVFEVSETSKPEHHNNTSICKVPTKQNRSEKGNNDIWQTFLDPKNLSTDEELINSGEYSEAAEVLNSNKNLLSEFLEEPNFLFTKQPRDLQSVRCNPQPSRINILKPSGVKLSARIETFSDFRRKAKGHIHRCKCDRYCYHENESDLISHLIKDHSILYKSKCQRQPEPCTLPTRIVVLKPNHEKYHNAEKGTPSLISLNKSLPVYRKKEFQSYKSHMFSEVSNRQRYHVTRKHKGSREIAREITESMRYNRRRASSNVWDSGNDDIFHEGSLCNMSEKETLMGIEASSRSSGQLDDLSSSYSDSSVNLFDSSVSWKAREHLSDRWVNSQRHQFQDVGSSGRGVSTLREMLAFSDRELPNAALINESQNRWDCPSGISSKDGWKDRCLKNLSRSKSLPVAIAGNSHSSGYVETSCSEDHMMSKIVSYLSTHGSSKGTFFKQLNSSQRKSRIGSKKALPVNFLREDIEHLVRERHLDSKKWSDIYLHKNKAVVSETPRTHRYKSTTSVNNVSAEHSEVPFKYDENELQTADPSMKFPVNGGFFVSDHNNMISKEMPPDRHHALSFNLHSPIKELELSNTSRSTQQSSPDSILEFPDDDGSSSPESVERVSAEFQDLRLQLQLFKLQSPGACAEGLEILSDDDTNKDRDISVQNLDPPCVFLDEDDRDFYYVHDMLNNSNLHGADLDMIPSECYLADAPVGPAVFQSLEKVYNKQPAWSPAERKLLFDFTNSLLSEVLVQNMDPHRWVKSKRRKGFIQGGKVLMEDIWQLLVRHRKELSCGDPEETILDVGWLNGADVIDAIGRKLENMLEDDLLNELVCELIVRRAR